MTLYWFAIRRYSTNKAMVNNDVLRSIRYTLDLSDKRVAQLISLGGDSATPEQLALYLLAESDEPRELCPDVTLAAFLNGLITDQRGVRENQPPLETKLNNNMVLKKLRIAFALRDDDILTLVQRAGSNLSLAELNAVFQKPDHKNFVICGDQLLRHFLSGLTAIYRKPDNPLYKKKV